jgi:hypothetical protein
MQGFGGGDMACSCSGVADPGHASGGNGGARVDGLVDGLNGPH